MLGPQIEVPQVFVAEYALAFVQRYLDGVSAATAEQITYKLAEHLARRYRNPLGSRTRCTAAWTIPVKHRLKQIPYRPPLVDGCLADGGLALGS
ncbi:hypothetical protein [Streptomyces olivochromogenes]|uniref:hypothetical protein n=1 Tax=Streptomyces olivochromogenes TaxID=1963 RepID=UPI001F460083|nr:hypothetical protein [Streptomyces olivochromogenes]MCF3130167.1 hypothetical protein [Streptomyces olivochromogenes]